jgi:septal ring factor EnvC (AmiA/AmiB activator)
MGRGLARATLAALLIWSAPAAADPDLSRLGAEIARAEAAVSAARAALRGATAALVDAEAAVAERRAASFGAYQAMDRLGRAPALAHFLHPSGPIGAARAAAVIEGALPDLKAALQAAEAEAADLARLRAEGAAATERLAASADTLSSLREDLATQLDAPARAEALAALRAALERPAADRATLERLIRQFGGPPGVRATPSGPAVAPVVGRIVAPYTPAAGLSVAAAPYAVVRAPLLSTVRHVGRTAQGDLVTVLEPQAGALIVLRGLGRVDRAPGEVLTAGEPLGAMGGPAPREGANDFLIDASALTVTLPDETLYIDLRVGGAPADPMDWFPPAEQRTNG